MAYNSAFGAGFDRIVFSASHGISSGVLTVAEGRRSKKASSYGVRLTVAGNSVGAVIQGLDGPPCGLSVGLGRASQDMVTAF